MSVSKIQNNDRGSESVSKDFIYFTALVATVYFVLSVSAILSGSSQVDTAINTSGYDYSGYSTLNKAQINHSIVRRDLGASMFSNDAIHTLSCSSETLVSDNDFMRLELPGIKYCGPPGNSGRTEL